MFFLLFFSAVAALKAALLEIASMETLLEAMLRVGQWDEKSPQILGWLLRENAWKPSSHKSRGHILARHHTVCYNFFLLAVLVSLPVF